MLLMLLLLLLVLLLLPPLLVVLGRATCRRRLRVTLQTLVLLWALPRGPRVPPPVGAPRQLMVPRCWVIKLGGKEALCTGQPGGFKVCGLGMWVLNAFEHGVRACS
jgi:hypothetical protein